MRVNAVHTTEDKCLEDLRKCLHNARILVAVNLNLVDQGNLDLGSFGECLKNSGEFLSGVRQSAGGEL